VLGYLAHNPPPPPFPKGHHKALDMVLL
jgi:hypothetical protein